MNTGLVLLVFIGGGILLLLILLRFLLEWMDTLGESDEDDS